MSSIFDLLKKIQKNTDENITGPVEYIVAGLGNPGKKYEKNRHNAGYMMIAEIANKCGVRDNKLKFSGVCAEVVLAKKKVLLLKPTTYMNLSGQSLKQAADFYKIPPERCIIIYDDVSLPVGKLRIRLKGSHGGQKGMKSIIEQCGTDAFPRVKIGIGECTHPEMDLADWVLSDFTADELATLAELSKNVIGALEMLIEGKAELAMGKYN